MTKFKLLMGLLMGSVSVGGAEEPPLLLRHTNYVVALAAAHQPLTAQLACVRHSYTTYEDSLRLRLIDDQNEEVLAREFLPEEKGQVSYRPLRSGLHLLVLDSGWNLATVRVNVPFALVAHQRCPLQFVRRPPRLYFYVPSGRRTFSLFVGSSVTGEGLRLVVYAPNGQVVCTEDGDFDKTTKLPLTVPPGAEGKVWSLAVLPPQTAGLVLDDVLLYLGENLPPYLCLQANWAEMFGKRKER